MTQNRREIKTVKTEDLYLKAMAQITCAYHSSSQQIKDLLTLYAITPQQYNVLKILKNQYPSPCTINLIKSKIVDQVTDASRLVERLIFKHYIEKKINTYDKRAVDIILTEKGLALLKKIDREVSFASIVSSRLSEDEVLALNMLLEKLNGCG